MKITYKPFIRALVLTMIVGAMASANIFTDIETGLNELVGADKRGHFRVGVYSTVICRDVLKMTEEDTIKANLVLGLTKGAIDYFIGGNVEILDLGAQLAGMGFKLGCEALGEML